MDLTRKVLAALMLFHPELIAKYAANSIEESKEDMPYYHHAQMVTNQFLDYFCFHDPVESEVASDTVMIWMLIFHDIDKQVSLATHGKIGEHDETVHTMQQYLRFIPSATKVEQKMVVRMVSTDPGGRAGPCQEAAKKQIPREVVDGTSRRAGTAGHSTTWLSPTPTWIRCWSASTPSTWRS